MAILEPSRLTVRGCIITGPPTSTPGYVYSQTEDERYLQTGMKILRELIDAQDWSNGPRKRGSTEMNSYSLSLMFFGELSIISVLWTES